MAIPAKHILHCEYPGVEFRHEFDASKIDYSDKNDDESYAEFLCDYISDELSPHVIHNLSTFLDNSSSGNWAPSGGHISYDEALTNFIDSCDWTFNKEINVYFDTFSKDGKVIESEEIDLEEYVDMEHVKYIVQECGLLDETDAGIEDALSDFVDSSEWQFALRKGYDFLDVEAWPAPKEDGSWVDTDGAEMEPCIWFGNDDDRWYLDGENLDFWLSDHPEDYVVDCQNDAFLGYTDGIPGFEEVVESCPVLIEKSDTPESIDKKIQAFFVEEYNEAHT